MRIREHEPNDEEWKYSFELLFPTNGEHDEVHYWCREALTNGYARTVVGVNVWFIMPAHNAMLFKMRWSDYITDC